MDIQFQIGAGLLVQFTGAHPFFQFVQHLGQLRTDEHGDNGRRGFIGAQPVVVPGRGDRGPQQAGIVVHGFDGIDKKGQELQVGAGCLAGSQQVFSGIGAYGPVVVFSGAVDTGKRFFMKQDPELMPAGDLVHQVHEQLVMVNGKVYRFVNRRAFKLSRGHLVVPGPQGNAQAVGFRFKIHHKPVYPFRDGPEIMVFELLPLGRGVAVECAPGDHEVRAAIIQGFINQEIFLFPTQCGRNTGYIPVEIMAYRHSCFFKALQGFQQRGFVIKSFPVVADKNGGDAQGFALFNFDDKGRGRGVPGRVTARFKCGPQSTGRKAAGIRLLLHQAVARKFFNAGGRPGQGEKRVMLFSGGPGQRLEPMGEVRGALADGPGLHARCHMVGYIAVDFGTGFNGCHHAEIGFLG